MRIGLVSPIVTANPGAHSPWEARAGVPELTAIAEAADRLGFDHLTCSEHIAVPRAAADQRGGTYWDPLATLSFLAARTSTIRLATHVLVLGYHHPLEIAKRYGTLDLLSGGRLVLGLGVGSLKEEFDLLGATFDGRGTIADEALQALRAALGHREPEFHGEHFDFAGLVVEPHSVQPHLPLWIGGRSLRSLQRARSLGDGWVPFGLALNEVRRMLHETQTESSTPFDVVLSTGKPLDPLAQPSRCLDRLGRVIGAGATLVSTVLAADSAEHYVDQLHALADLVMGQAELHPLTTHQGEP
jgi:probable F420-dependent oxidoreductase